MRISSISTLWTNNSINNINNNKKKYVQYPFLIKLQMMFLSNLHSLLQPIKGLTLWDILFIS